jgi:hypothetical protein
MVVQPGQYPMDFHEASYVQEMKRMKDALPSGLRIGKERGDPLILTQDWKRCRMFVLLLLSDEWNGYSFPTFPRMERMEDAPLIMSQEWKGWRMLLSSCPRN